jgi:hypothetical protein
MSLLSKTGLRRTLLALATLTAASALFAAPALADHGHHGGGVWFPPIPQVFVPFPPVVVIGGPHGHGCDYDDHHGYYSGGYGHGYRGNYYSEGRHHGHGRRYGHGGHGHRGHGHRGRGHGGHGGHDD